MAVIALIVLNFGVFAQPSITTSDDEKVLIVEDAKDSEIFAFGKTVIVKKEAKNVLAFGGDVIVEGSVREDVAAVGGSVIQKEGAFIGGDVFALGGSYKPEGARPLRNPGRETVMYAGYEEEIRDLALNPAQILSPTLSWTFLVQRALSVLFWFVVALAFTTIAPGAVGRAVARFQLSGLKITAVGVLGLVAVTVGMILGLSFLPGFLSTIIGMMAMFLLVLAYVFGRVALQVSVGKAIQKMVMPEKHQSETMAILLGVVAWTIILSIPYLWTLALILLFSSSIGLVVSARSVNRWPRTQF